MAVKIRLRRMGSKKNPFYRVVVADSRSPRDGKFKEELGVYDPLKEPSLVDVKEDRVRYWIENGAKPTDRLYRLLKKRYDIKVKSLEE